MSVSLSILAACVAAVAYGFALVGGGLAASAVLGRLARVTTPPVDIASAFSIGLGLYGAIWILLGLAGWLIIPVVILVLTAGFICGIWYISGWVPPKHETKGLFTAPGLLLLVCLAALLVVLGLSSLRPPFGDPVAFYLAWPKVIAATGTIEVLPGNYAAFCSIWMLSEAHFSALLILGGEHAAKVFIWVSLLAAAHSMWLLARACDCSPRGCLLAVVALVTSTAVVNVAVDGKTDLIAVAPALSSVLWALRLGLDRRATVLTGWLSGTALGAKLTYIVPLGAALASLVMVAALVVHPPGARLRGMARWLVLIGVAAILVLLPQFIKNQVLFSNPLLPLLGSGIGRDIWFSDATTRRILLMLPLSLTFGMYPGQHGDLSPLVLGGLGLLIVSGWWRELTPRLCRITLAAVVAIAAWFFVMPSQIAPRYFLAPLLLAVIPAAWTLQRAWAREGFLALCATLSFALVTIGVVMSDTLLVHAKAAQQYIAAELNRGDACIGDSYCDILERANREMKPGERLLLLSYYRYYLRPDILQCLVAEPHVPIVGADAVQRLGVDYILVDRAGYYRPDYPVDGEAFNLIYDAPDFRLYRARPELSVGATQRPRCIEDRPGRWKVSP